MPIQDEKKVPAFLVPQTPEGKDDLIKWAQETNKVLNQINRQFVSYYNLHLDNPYAHPKAWDIWRVYRPYFFSTSASTTLTLPASSSLPVNFLIGGTLLQVTSNLTMDLNTAGPGGLRSGLTKAANTVYYLYGVKNAGTVALLSDTNDPNTGPSGFSDWTYLGAFVTITAAATIVPFQSVNGRCELDVRTSHVTQTGSTSFVSKTITIPTTARFCSGLLEVTGATTTSASATVAGTSAPSDVAHTIDNLSATLTTKGQVFLPIFTPQTVFLQTLVAGNTVGFWVLGWQENIQEWK